MYVWVEWALLKYVCKDSFVIVVFEYFQMVRISGVGKCWVSQGHIQIESKNHKEGAHPETSLSIVKMLIECWWIELVIFQRKR